MDKSENIKTGDEGERIAAEYLEVQSDFLCLDNELRMNYYVRK